MTVPSLQPQRFQVFTSITVIDASFPDGLHRRIRGIGTDLTRPVANVFAGPRVPQPSALLSGPELECASDRGLFVLP